MNIAAEHERTAVPPLVSRVNIHRLEATNSLDRSQRSELGQFLTPPAIAAFMASLFGPFHGGVRVLDAGAGVGSLLAAFAAEACARKVKPAAIHATAFDIDPRLVSYLRRTAQYCQDECSHAGVKLTSDVIEADFIQAAVDQLDGGLFGPARTLSFTHAILNPPYKKLRSDSADRMALRRAGIETSNLYTAFLGLAILLLEPGGELVAITPRSFCNGPYFRPFRELFLREMSLRRVHVFESRKAAFAEDEVLQENVILHAVKGAPADRVMISCSAGPNEGPFAERTVPFQEVVRPGDPERFIHVVPDDSGEMVAGTFARLPSRLEDLDISVSTGKVVDFRVRSHLRQEPDESTWPLIYPTHFADGLVKWPKQGKKPNGLVRAPETADLWMPSGTYVLVKRFSAKEERRRIVPALFDPRLVPGDEVGFENHLNVFHRHGKGLPVLVARGLAAFLGSTLVDTYFRQYSGHTQVNATDLRNLRYPDLQTLEEVGRRVLVTELAQENLDSIVDEVLGLSGQP